MVGNLDSNTPRNLGCTLVHFGTGNNEISEIFNNLLYSQIQCSIVQQNYKYKIKCLELQSKEVFGETLR